VAVVAFAVTQNQYVLLGVIVVALALYIMRSYMVVSRNRRKSQQS
jgi:hypothetical protein